jgi:hypothetical protein
VDRSALTAGRAARRAPRTSPSCPSCCDRLPTRHRRTPALNNTMPPRARSRPRPLDRFIEPCLPRPAAAPPSGQGWLHEIKHDGFLPVSQ